MLTGGTALKAAILAGLLSGLLVALFHFVLTEPVIDRAIALEEQAAAAKSEPREAPAVSRDVQKGVGLFFGWALYGVLAGVVVGGVFTLAQDKLPGAGPSRKGLALAALAFLSVALLPFLKHPANPPAVGDPTTHPYRVTIQLTFQALSIAGVIGGLALYRALARRPTASAARRWRWPIVLGAYLGYVALAYLVVPPNPDAVNAPVDMVTEFRVLSLAGLAVLWAAMGLLFGLFNRLLVPRPAPARDVRRALGAAS